MLILQGLEFPNCKKTFHWKALNSWKKKNDLSLLFLKTIYLKILIFETKINKSGVINIQIYILNFKIEKELLDPHDCQRH